MRAIDARVKRIKELEESIRLREGLPHLFGWKWYKWARAFFESQNRTCLLTAGNQLSKSSTQIRKVIHWATAPKLWPSLWPKYRHGVPLQFWYMYPSSQQATSEYHTKWQQFLPRGEFRNHPVYGWKPDIQQKQIKAIYFNSGVRLYFKSYTQKDTNLQSSTLNYVATDEEVPVHLYDELVFRLSAAGGHFSSVFTATLGQDFWRRVMEPEEGEKELLPDAFKLTVSAYDCLFYEDGTPSHWTTEDIKRIEASCSTHNEVLKRVHGRFIKDVDGRKFPTFDIKKHVRQPEPVPETWSIYAAVDLGSGIGNHPAAIVFLAVNPDLTFGRVIKCWRGDGVVTSAGDVFARFLEMKAEIARPITGQYYDFAGKDFDIITSRAGEPFIKAEKNHERGEHVLNTAFKFGMLTIDESEEARKLALELSTLAKSGKRKNQCDDLADALRYAAVAVPWDFSKTVLPAENQSQSEEIDEETKKPKSSRFGDAIVIEHAFGDEQDEIEAELSELSSLLGY